MITTYLNSFLLSLENKYKVKRYIYQTNPTINHTSASPKLPRNWKRATTKQNAQTL
jgi:hypothetical protein